MSNMKKDVYVIEIMAKNICFEPIKIKNFLCLGFKSDKLIPGWYG